jgi:hypothetical protein
LRALDILQKNLLPLHQRFADKTPEVLATTSSWLVSRPALTGSVPA